LGNFDIGAFGGFPQGVQGRAPDGFQGFGRFFPPGKIWIGQLLDKLDDGSGVMFPGHVFLVPALVRW
jgi:hypothetical protein